MVTETVATFEDSLGQLDVEWTHTTSDGFEATVASLIEEPAVGVSLPFDGASLPDAVTVDPTAAALESARTSVTPASFGVAEYGSVVLASTPGGAEPVSLYPELHVPVVRADDVVPGMPEAFDRFGSEIREHRSSSIIATGPSATADMGDLVFGAHGPKEVHVVILDE
ncbi:LutC/YkgG family protein [Salinirarus marinus]|uniref:LutC/YkgG family protein n=1 Tax=Salinirarus marinus TaxID=3068310 RepID=UPI003C6BE74A